MFPSGPSTRCQGWLNFPGVSKPGLNTEHECVLDCKSRRACRGAQWTERATGASRCRHFGRVCHVKTVNDAAQESMPGAVHKCWRKCHDPRDPIDRCDYKVKMQCPYNCQDWKAVDQIAITQGQADMWPLTYEKCQRACENHPQCSGFVYGDNPPSCQGVKGPSTKFDNYPELRPLSGVQLGRCSVPNPPNGIDFQTDDGKCPKPDPYAPGPQTTNFISCRSPPWALCGTCGDPHITTFDRPHAFVNCPTSAKSRGATVLQAYQKGIYALVEMPPRGASGVTANTGSDLLVAGRFGYTVNHPSNANTMGVSVQGSLLGGYKMVIEIEANGAVNPIWIHPSGMGELFLAFDPNDNSDRLRRDWPSANGGVNCSFGYFDHRLVDFNKQDDDKTSKEKPLWICSFKDENGEDFLKLFVNWVNNEYIDFIVSMRKDYDSPQEGLCGNFDCDPRNDDKDKTEQARWQLQSPGLFSHVGAQGRRLQRSEEEEAALHVERRLNAMPVEQGVAVCRNAGVESGIDELCGTDLSLAADGLTNEEKDSMVEGYLSYQKILNHLP